MKLKSDQGFAARVRSPRAGNHEWLGPG